MENLKSAFFNTQNKTRFYLLVGITALLGGFIGALVYHQYADYPNTQPTVSGSIHGLASKIHRTIRDIGRPSNLLINPEGTCDEPSCVQCKDEIPQKRPSHGEPLHCDNEKDDRVINGSCYLCDGICKTFDELKELRNTGIRCDLRPMRITCCLLAQIGNLLEDPVNRCGNDGKYECYDNHNNEPVCECERGWQGDRCQDMLTELVRCRCYKGGYKFCGEEALMDCSNINHMWSQCHRYINRSGQQLNCVCNSMTNESPVYVTSNSGTYDEATESCSNPHSSATYTNSANSSAVSVSMLLLILAAYVVI